MQRFSGKHKKIVFGVIVFLVFFNFSLIPYFHKREAARAVQDVLKLWTTGDYALAIDYWEIQESSPPVYGVASYKILSKTFDKKNGKRRAKILVDLEFSSGNVLPSGEWYFELAKTSLGWKILDFYLRND